MAAAAAGRRRRQGDGLAIIGTPTSPRASRSICGVRDVTKSEDGEGIFKKEDYINRLEWEGNRYTVFLQSPDHCNMVIGATRNSRFMNDNGETSIILSSQVGRFENGTPLPKSHLADWLLTRRWRTHRDGRPR